MSSKSIIGSLVVALALVVGSCSDASEPSPPAASRNESTPSSRTPESPANTETRVARPFDPRRVKLELKEVASGLSSPLGIVNAGDGTGRLFIVEQGGTVRIITKNGLRANPFLNVSDRITSGGERGLLGLAFHPRFETNRRFFVNYTDVNGDTVVSEFEASARGSSADESSERILLQIDQPFGNHNGGQIAFGPDGYLYIATGDGGSGGDPQGNGQSLNTLLGKLLRIDVNGSDAGRAYAIPNDNPFVGRSDARPEIWAYGLRNPWRFGFDNSAQKIWVADVGQSDFEEVNRAPSAKGGINYGWNVLEGRNCFGGGSCDRTGMRLPITGYDHGAGCSITGGYVYRGRAWPKLRGGYLFGDFCSGTMWVVDAKARGFTRPTPVFEGSISVSSFGVSRKRLYVSDLASGTIFKITAP